MQKKEREEHRKTQVLETAFRIQEKVWCRIEIRDTLLF